MRLHHLAAAALCLAACACDRAPPTSIPLPSEPTKPLNCQNDAGEWVHCKPTPNTEGPRQ